jgi:hypothetical protein
VSCAFCRHNIGKIQFHDTIRRLFFCSQNCWYRYLSILALWEEILDADG